MVVGPSGVRTVGSGGVLLGAFEGSRFDDHIASLDRDETMLLYTDGITEARFGSGSELYGEEGLASFLASVRDPDPCTLLPLVLDAARTFAKGSLEDDVAMLAIKPLGMTAVDAPPG
jgi:sigma-B regulation protein RsbU (phosphoserine phosphatase)